MTVMLSPQNHESMRKCPTSKRDRINYESAWSQILQAGQSQNVVECIVSHDEAGHELQDIGLAESIMAKVADSDSNLDPWIQEGVLGGISDVECRRELQVQIGCTVYPFIRPLLMRYFKNEGVLLASPLISQSLPIEGRGEDYAACFHGYAERFHLKFQELDALIPSEMDDIQLQEWSCLASFVNIKAYRQETPIEFRRVGVVVSRDPFTVKWIDQETDERVDLATAPSNLAAFPKGTWLEAVVSYNRRDDCVTRILSAETTPPLSLTEGVEHPSLSDLPKDDWKSI